MASELLVAGERNRLAFGSLSIFNQLPAETGPSGGPVAAGNATAGRHLGTDGAGPQTITIQTTAVKSSSLIFLGIDSVYSTGSYVDNIIDGVSFDITNPRTAPAPRPQNLAGRTAWWIINTE